MIKNPLKKPKLNPLFSRFLFQRNKNTRIKKKNKNTQNLPFQPNNFAPKGFRPDPRFAIVEWSARVKGWRPAKERKKKFEEGETTRESLRNRTRAKARERRTNRPSSRFNFRLDKFSNAGEKPTRGLSGRRGRMVNPLSPPSPLPPFCRSNGIFYAVENAISLYCTLKYRQQGYSRIVFAYPRLSILFSSEIISERARG